MSIKKVEIHVTKFYILSWMFGLAGLFLLWMNWNIPAGLSFLLCYTYSVADYKNPNPPDDNRNPPTGPNFDDDNIKPS
jgi:hypothetical protein